MEGVQSCDRPSTARGGPAQMENRAISVAASGSESGGSG